MLSINLDKPHSEQLKKQQGVMHERLFCLIGSVGNNSRVHLKPGKQLLLPVKRLPGILSHECACVPKKDSFILYGSRTRPKGSIYEPRAIF